MSDRAEKDRRYRVKNDATRKAAQAAWREANADHIKAKCARRRLEKRAMCLVAAARVRSRAKGIPFELGPNDVELLQRVIDAGRCELSGAPFMLTGARGPRSPSLDRKVPSLGYVSGNVRVICHALNAALGDWGEIALLEIIDTWTATRSTRKPRVSSSKHSQE